MDNLDDRAETIFQHAVRINEATTRERYIRESCDSDSALEYRVRALLNVTAERTTTMGSGVPKSTTIDFVLDSSDKVGSIIGPYELIELIGAGGMGLVFLAQQHSPVQRQVALKIIRPGMDDESGVRRFEAERQTLAHLSHPGIARLLDAGTTAAGRPWFVMELAQGIPVTDFCRQKSLPLEERLQLFELVCEAIDHAHQQGVIHRDIKPANILVTSVSGRYLPRIIDFGVARINPLQHKRHRSGNPSDTSQPGKILGTPAYMSPEQTYMQDSELDARSDVYSLGILLYRLLTDATPFPGVNWRELEYAETRRIIHQLTPSVPSERVLQFSEGKGSTTSPSTPDENQSTDELVCIRSAQDWRRLSARLKGDLDWITMKAIEKDRDDRYESVGAMTADILRYLRHEPVNAGPASRIYRFRKFVRRRISRLVVLSLILCLLLLLSFSLMIAKMLLYEREESERFRQLVRDGNQLIDIRDEVIRSQNYAIEMQAGFAAYFHGNVDRARASVEQFSSGNGASADTGFEWHYLNQLCLDSPNILTGDDGKVYSVAFSPDNRLLASSAWGSSGTVHIRNAVSGALLQSIRGIESDVNSTCFDSKGTIVLTSEDSAKVRIWDALTGELKGHLDEFDHGVSQIFLASDDRTLIASEVDWGPLKSKTSVWDLKTQTRTIRIDQQRMLDVSESQGIVATCSDDGEICLRRFPDLEVLTTFDGSHVATDCGCLSHDGKVLATGNKLGTVRIWRRDLSGSELLFDPGPSAAAIRDIEFSSDDQLLFVAKSDGIIQIWNMVSKMPQRVLNTGMSDAWSLDVSQDGNTLAVGYTRGRVELRDVASQAALRKTIHRSTTPFRFVAHDADGGRMAIIDSAGSNVTVQSSTDGAIVLAVPAPAGVEFQNVAFSADNQALWITDAAGLIFKLVLATGDVAQQPAMFNLSLTMPLVSTDGRLLGLNSSLNSEKFAVAWDPQANKEIFRIPVGTHAAQGERSLILGFPDDKTLIESTGNRIYQWDFSAGKIMLPEFPGQSDVIAHTSFFPDRRTLLVGLVNADAYFVDIESRKTIGMLQELKDVLAAAAFSLDGRTLATATQSGRIKLWHVSTRQSIYELPRFDEKVLSLWFNSDGTRLFVAVERPSGDREIVVWDASDP